ncbi:efflux RND transporter periplasmic adaptor subunit, partial [bacterium]|nr:efflux RND transporter periplasmic adaptor subunit [bacterium]
SKNGEKAQETLVIHAGDFVQEISISGKVTAAKEVELGFSQSGRISSVFASVGKTVSAGTVLASIENESAQGDVLQKEASLEAAQAKLEILKKGTREEQLAVTESRINSARIALNQKNQSVVDVLKNAYTQSDEAVRRRVDQFMINPRSSRPELAFLVTDIQLKSDIEWNRFVEEAMLVEWKKAVDTITVEGNLDEEILRATKNLDDTREFLDMVSLAVNSLSPSQNITQATIDAYRADITAARANIHSATIAITTAVTEARAAAASLETEESNLGLEKAGATKEELAEQEARVKAAEADLLTARAELQKTYIVAPFTGIITAVDAKAGGSATVGAPLISMISAAKLQLESFVPELNIPLIAVGDDAIVTLDAYGESDTFGAKIVAIDPAETVRDGVSTYRIVLEFMEQDPRVKPGMTANIAVTTDKKEGVISIPQGMVKEIDGKKVVYVKEKEGDIFLEREVETGSVSSIGNVEILSGLAEEDIVSFNPPIE